MRLTYITLVISGEGQLFNALFRTTTGFPSSDEPDMLGTAMRPTDLETGLIMGCVLIALGLTPGLFRGLTNGIARGLLNFRNSLSSPVPITPPRHAPDEKAHRSIWIAAIGLGLILLSLFGYLTQ